MYEISIKILIFNPNSVFNNGFKIAVLHLIVFFNSIIQVSQVIDRSEDTCLIQLPLSTVGFDWHIQ